MPGGVVILEGIITDVTVAVEGLEICRVGNGCVWLDESSEHRVVVARFVIIQTRIDIVTLPCIARVEFQIRVEGVGFLTEGRVLEALEEVAFFIGDPCVFRCPLPFRKNVARS